MSNSRDSEWSDPHQRREGGRLPVRGGCLQPRVPHGRVQQEPQVQEGNLESESHANVW